MIFVKGNSLEASVFDIVSIKLFYILKKINLLVLENLMVRNCHFVVYSCWNLRCCMIDHVVMLV